MVSHLVRRDRMNGIEVGFASVHNVADPCEHRGRELAQDWFDFLIVQPVESAWSGDERKAFQDNRLEGGTECRSIDAAIYRSQH